MKKIVLFLFAFLSILLVSCGKDDEIVVRRDNPHATNASLLALESVKTGNPILEVDQTLSDYYLVKGAADLASSLFVYETSLDETFAYHDEKDEVVKKANISALTFSAEISDNELLQIMTTAFAEGALTKEKLGISSELNISSAVSTSVDISAEFAAYEGENVTGNKLVVAYLPTYVERISKSELVLAVYVMVPVYYEVVSSNKAASSVFDSIAKPELVINEETGLLASNEG